MSVIVNERQQMSFKDVENGLLEANSAKDLVARTRSVFNAGKTIPLAFRKKQLKNLKKFLIDQENALCRAVHEDLRKPRDEIKTHELIFLWNEIRIFLDKINDWVKPEHITKTIMNILDDVCIHNDPLGVVLVIGAWNYPVHLSLAPVIGEFTDFLAYAYKNRYKKTQILIIRNRQKHIEY